MKKIILQLSILLFLTECASAQSIVGNNRVGSFPLLSASEKATIVYDAMDDSLVQKAALLFRKDLNAVTGKTVAVSTELPSAKTIVLIGSVGKSGFIQQLVKAKKLRVDSLRTKWEGYQIQVVSNPFKGIAQALVITGSDRRGTAYGVFEVAKQIGVSPWYWWADVPVKKKSELFIKRSAFLTDAPKVKYRGIFINDEAPALSNWSREKFGGFNHQFYEKVFELILRLKGNYLWPAMWGNAFYDDDPLNRQTADTWGIVIGTSHHEPLMRAHDEWRRYGKSKWNYDSNEVRLKSFWREGVQRATNEKIISIGMRGDGDEPMSRETATVLLERIVKDQRQIIEDVTGKPASETPQLWALYKEVQDYYDKGMRVPDDVTLLLCDDNWGNIRKLPKLTDKPRSGGYGIYYHFDYVGDPRNYKWINTNNLARVWEQMHLAYAHGVNKIWIVNVGDIKPMELPTSFFLDYAWNPDKWNEDNIRTYYSNWAAQQFGESQSKQIGEILRTYSQWAARRKPELLDATTYSLTNHEWETVVDEWKSLAAKAEAINRKLPVQNRDAFFQLVLHPVKAMDNLHELYYAVALNQENAKEGVLSANSYADAAKELYKTDSLLTVQYHHIAGGKWNHMMDQTHIGYTYWQQPPTNSMPNLTYLATGQVNDTTLNLGQKAPSRNISKGNVFHEKNGVLSIEAQHWTRAVDMKINGQKIYWKAIPDIGKTGSGITTFPVTASLPLTANSPHVEYDVYTDSEDNAKLSLYFSPTLNFHNDEGLQYAISVDEEKPQVFSLNKEDNNVNVWKGWVANNIIVKTITLSKLKPGKHKLTYWMISPAIILQKITLDFGGIADSYLGPTETRE